MKNWYLIQTKPKQESIAKENLERQNYPVYLPMAIARRKRRGKSVRVIEAMFPRYLFIQLSEKIDDWGPIRSTMGVSSLIRFGLEPAKVPQILIDSLKARENAEGIHELPIKKIELGQNVVISEGIFEGYEAIYHSTAGKDRIIVLLNIAENYAKITLDQRMVELQ